MADLLCVLGRLGVQVQGEMISTTLPGRRAELAFAMLAVEHRRVVTRDELADALWPAELPGAWAGSLRGVVSEVRRFLGDAGLTADEVLVTAEGGYCLRLPGGVSTDLDVARDAVAQAEERLAAGDAGAAVAAATKAEVLTEARFLPAHEGTWVDGLRRDVEVLHLRALAVAARARSRVGDALGAAAAAERLCRADPFDESAHQLRIRILGETGDRAGARLAYQHCVAVLRDELDAQPSAETEAALQEALGQVPGAPDAKPATVVSEHAGYSVLVVEDHDFQRRTAGMLLRSMGVGTVLEAADGAEALNVIARTAPPDIILCDVDMPGMDGVEFIRRIAEQGLASSVVVTSALDPGMLSAVERVTAGYGLTLLGSIEKPLTTRRLAEVLDRHIGTTGAGELADPAGAAAELRRAIGTGDVAVLFEPVIDLATGRPYQAVARPALSSAAVPTAAPDDVVDRALLGTDTAVTAVAALVAASSAAAGSWRAGGLELGTTVRLPARATADVGLVERLVASASTAGASAGATAGPASRGITVRVDEAVVRHDHTVTLDVLTRLRLRGFGVSLQLSTVAGPAHDIALGLPLTEIHLDGALVAGAGGTPRRLALLEAAIEQARSAKVPVVATGCQSAADVEAALAVGCDGAHGRHLAVPMPASDIAGWAARWECTKVGQ